MRRERHRARQRRLRRLSRRCERDASQASSRTFMSSRPEARLWSWDCFHLVGGDASWTSSPLPVTFAAVTLHLFVVPGGTIKPIPTLTLRCRNLLAKGTASCVVVGEPSVVHGCSSRRDAADVWMDRPTVCWRLVSLGSPSSPQTVALFGSRWLNLFTTSLPYDLGSSFQHMRATSNIPPYQV